MPLDRASKAALVSLTARLDRLDSDNLRLRQAQLSLAYLNDGTQAQPVARLCQIEGL